MNKMDPTETIMYRNFANATFMSVVIFLYHPHIDMYRPYLSPEHLPRYIDLLEYCQAHHIKILPLSRRGLHLIYFLRYRKVWKLIAKFDLHFTDADKELLKNAIEEVDRLQTA